MKNQKAKVGGCYTLVLRPLKDPDEVPVLVRLRRVLKSLLRSYHFRCVEIRPAEAGDGQDQGQTAAVVPAGNVADVAIPEG